MTVVEYWKILGICDFGKFTNRTGLLMGWKIFDVCDCVGGGFSAKVREMSEQVDKYGVAKLVAVEKLWIKGGKSCVKLCGKMVESFTQNLRFAGFAQFCGKLCTNGGILWIKVHNVFRRQITEVRDEFCTVSTRPTTTTTNILEGEKNGD